MRRTIILLAAAGLLAGCSAATDTDTATTADAPADVVDDDTLTVLAQYDILEGDALGGEVEPAHEDVWERFSELVPPDLRPEVVQFVAIDMEQSGGTDGAMQKSGLDEADYYIALDVTGASTELDRTIIHEFGHLATLGPEQVELESEDVDCDTFTFDGNCPVGDAIIRAWSDEFWPGYDEADLDDELASPEDEASERFDPTVFVTEYAATSPTEDFSEVFAEWVIRDEAPDDGTELAAKFAFMDTWPELVEIRATMREVL